jgi:hypothetical protein
MCDKEAIEDIKKGVAGYCNSLVVFQDGES